MEKENEGASVTNTADVEEQNTATTVPEQQDAPEAPLDEGSGGDLPTKTEEQKSKVYNKKALSFHTAKPLKREGFPHQPRTVTSPLPTTIPNIAYMFREYGIRVRYNVIKKKIEILIPGHTATFDNRDNVSITHIISLTKLNGIATEQIPSYVEALADQNQYNPAAEWINSKPWDEKDRLPDIYATITEREGYPTYLKETLIYKWFLSAVAAVLMPSGFKNRGVLTFQGCTGNRENPLDHVFSIRRNITGVDS